MRRRDKRPSTVVAKPPPEAAPRVDGGGPWGPTAFDLPDPKGNRRSVLAVAAAGTVVLLALVGFLAWFYFRVT